MSKNESAKNAVLITPQAKQRGMTGLHYAAYCNDPVVVEAQLKSGLYVDDRDDAGWTPLHWSIDMAQVWGEPEKAVSVLLASGASANAVDSSGYSVLMMACARNNANILEQLVAAGVDVHARNAGTTPLHEAAGCNFSEAIRKLLLLGADPLETDAHNRTPEQVAEQYGFEESAAVFRAARSAK
jgi:ankyrin repeat protein